MCVCVCVCVYILFPFTLYMFPNIGEPLLRLMFAGVVCVCVRLLKVNFVH